MIRLAKKYFQLNPKTRQIHYPPSIKGFFVDRIRDGSKEPEPVFRGEQFLSSWYAKEDITPVLYVDYWGFDVDPDTVFHPSDVGGNDRMEHHFRVLYQEELYDFIFIVDKGFPVHELFEVVQ